MAYYDESGGDSQPYGRPPKSYEGGILGPRRPRTFASRPTLAFLCLPVHPANLALLGLVTDYGSSLVQWMRTRRPRYKGGHRMETERPSASYVVDVSFHPML